MVGSTVVDHPEASTGKRTTEDVESRGNEDPLAFADGRKVNLVANG